MTGVLHFRLKPVPSREEPMIAARYEPGQSLDALTRVAHSYDDDAELAEVPLESGPVLLVRYLNMEGERCFVAWEVVEAGRYLVRTGALSVTDQAGIDRWYELVPEGGRDS